ncbi:MAG: adenylate/guanylate cyclase domain-containing protein [Bdellovibrionota bacterium]
MGFSIAAEQFPPKQAFAHLRHEIQAIIRVIHAHGGIVDKIQGDGVLCFFGYAYDGDVSPENHAETAIQCAIALQEDAVERAQSAISEKRPVFPLRIGVNTSLVQVGNLGTGKKIEITLIGHGVNYCKRLESAADSFGILVSESTRMRLHADFALAAFKLRQIRIKHLETPQPVYECTPKHLDEQKRDQALDEYRRQQGMSRQDPRFFVGRNCPVQVETSYGPASLVDFSSSGIGLVMDAYLAKQVSVQIRLLGPDKNLEQELQSIGLFPVIASVCWARELEPQKFRTGLSLQGLNDSQRERLKSILIAATAVETAA